MSEGVAGSPTQLAGLDEEKYIQGYSRALTDCLPGNREAIGSVWRRGEETVHTHLLPGVNVALDIIRKLPKDV